MYFSFSRARTVLPATPFLLTTTGSVSTEKLTSSLSSTSRPTCFLFDDEPAAPLTTISSPRRMTVFGEGSLTDPCCRRRSTKILFCCPAMYCSNSRTVRPGSNHSLSALKARKTIVRAARVESRTEAHVVPHLRFHLLGRLLYFRDAAEQPRAEGAEYPGRSGRAVDVGDRVADRHHAQVRVASAGQLVNRIGGGSDDGRHRLRAGQQAAACAAS